MLISELFIDRYLLVKLIASHRKKLLEIRFIANSFKLIRDMLVEPCIGLGVMAQINSFRLMYI